MAGSPDPTVIQLGDVIALQIPAFQALNTNVLVLPGSRALSLSQLPLSNSFLAFEDLRLQKGVIVNCPSSREELHGLGHFLHSLLPC
jgi:hypothetical protein